MYVQPFDAQLGPTTLAPLGNEQENLQPAMGSALPQTFGEGDAISRLVPPWITNGMMQNPLQTAAFGPLAGLLQQLLQMLQSIMGYGGCGGYGGYTGSGGCGSYGGEQYFANANGSSVGDPHLSFNGNHWNSMVSQPDLLHSDSIPGGFQISTQVTPPSARGVTYNQSATVSLNGGQTTISLNDDGQPSIESFGRNVPINDGQTVELGNGASVTRNLNGSLSITAQNAEGGRIATTLTAQGRGVNVETSAQNVDLGGALVDGEQGQPVYGPPRPIGGGPILDPFPPIIGGPITSPITLTPPMNGTPVIPGPPPMNGTPVFAPHPPIRMQPF